MSLYRYLLTQGRVYTVSTNQQPTASPGHKLVTNWKQQFHSKIHTVLTYFILHGCMHSTTDNLFKTKLLKKFML